LAVLDTDLSHQLMLSPARLQRLVDRLDASLLLPVTVPTVEFTALWDAGWSGPRAGAFPHRRLNDLRRPAFVTLLSDAPDWRALQMSFKVWTNAPTGSEFRLASPIGRQVWKLDEELTTLETLVWVRPGRTTLKISTASMQLGIGAFIDVGDLQIRSPDGETPAYRLRSDVDDDGMLILASPAAALRRLHSFGFLGSQFDVYCRGSRLAAFSGTAVTRASDLAPIVGGDLRAAADDLAAPQRATALIRLLRTERP
jgi:hypothetical protein